jgi:hypothetical protein
MSSSSAATDTKVTAPRAAPVVSTRLAALYDALPDVPKPVVHMISAYLCRLPPSEVIRTLMGVLDCPALQRDGRTLFPFSTGAELSAAVPNSFGPDDWFIPKTFVVAADVVTDRNVRLLGPNGRNSLTAALQATDQAALCVLELSTPTGSCPAYACTLFLAVPDGFTAAESGTKEGLQHWPLIGVAGRRAALTAEGQLCGLLSYCPFWMFD